MTTLRRRNLAALALCALAVSAAPARAQAILPIVVGESVAVIDASSKETKGIVISADSLGIRIRVDGQEQMHRADDIREVWWLGDTLKNGIEWGSAAGTGAGFLMGIRWGRQKYDRGGSEIISIAGGIAVGSISGAVLGALIDRSHLGRTLAYRAAAHKVTIAPVAPPHRRAVVLALNF